MYRHSVRIQNMIGKLIPLLAAVLMIAFAVMPAYAVKSQDSRASSVQKAKSQIRALTADQTLSAVSQDVTGAITDIYPQYKDYSGEMEGVSVNKKWTGDAEYNRPDSVTFDLYLDGKVIDSLTLTADDDWSGSFSSHYPAYKLDKNGNYELDSSGDKIPLDYQVRERDVENYKPAYSQSRHQTKVDSSSMHLFVPAEKLKEGGKYYIVSCSDPGQQKVYRGEAYQTENVLSAQMNITEGKIRDKDGNTYSNYILVNDGDGTYDGLLWNAYSAGNGAYYMFSNIYEIWSECHGLLQMSSTQKKMSCPHVSKLGEGTDKDSQGFYNVGDNAYKTKDSTEKLYFYEEVTLPDGAFNSWQTEALVSNRYEPPITVDPGSGESEKTDLSVSKTWKNDKESDRPDNIKVHLYANGKDTGKTLTLDKNNSWAASFKDLDVYDKEGRKISYSVSEDVPKGYFAKYDYDDNSASGERSSSGGYWVRTDKLVDGETYLIVTSPGTGSVVGMEIQPGGKSFKWTKGNAGTINVEGPVTINGQTYATHITNEEAEKHKQMQWTAHYNSSSESPQTGYHDWYLLESVSNPGCYPKFNGEGDISDGSAHESLLYYGLQYKKKSSNNNRDGYVAIDDKGNEQITPSVKNYPDDFNYVFGNHDHYFLLSNNHTGDANAVTAQTFYLYKFVPVSGPSVTITNTKSEETSLTVYKNWNDNNNSGETRPASVTVELLKNGRKTGVTAKLDASNSWKCVFDHLQKYDENGKEIRYSAVETDLPAGYTGSVTDGIVEGSKEEMTYSYAWVPVTTLTSGGEYILADSNSGSCSTIGVKDGKATMSGASAMVKTDSVLTDENGSSYTAYITDDDAAKLTKWTAEASGSYVKLKYGEKYFKKGSGDLVQNSNEAAQIVYDDVNHALKNNKNKYLAENGDFNKDKKEVETYIYERVRIKNTKVTESTVNVTTITNTYKKVNMPETGMKGRMYVMLLGSLMLIGGTLLMINNKKRGGIRFR